MESTEKRKRPKGGCRKILSIMIISAITSVILIAFLISYANREIALGVDWEPNGEWIVFACSVPYLNDPRDQLFIMRGDGSNLQLLTSDSYRARTPRWSPDGMWVSFISRNAIYIMRPDGSQIQKIAGALSIEDITAYVWNSDAASFTLATQSITGTTRIYTITIGETSAPVIAEGSSPYYALAWLSDSELLVLENLNTIKIFNLEQGTWQSIYTSHEIRGFHVMPQGKLLLVQRDVRSLYLTDIEHGFSEQIQLPFFRGIGSIPPNDDGTILYSGVREDGENWGQIYRGNYLTGNSERLTSMDYCNAYSAVLFDFGHN